MATSSAHRIERIKDHGIEPTAISSSELFVADFSKRRAGAGFGSHL